MFVNVILKVGQETVEAWMYTEEESTPNCLRVLSDSHLRPMADGC